MHTAGTSKSARKRAKEKEKQRSMGEQQQRSASALNLSAANPPNLSHSSSSPDLQVSTMSIAALLTLLMQQALCYGIN